MNSSMLVRPHHEPSDYRGRHLRGAHIGLIPIQQINQAYDRLLKNDVKYRFVIDIASLRWN